MDNALNFVKIINKYIESSVKIGRRLMTDDILFDFYYLELVELNEENLICVVLDKPYQSEEDGEFLVSFIGKGSLKDMTNIKTNWLRSKVFVLDRKIEKIITTHQKNSLLKRKEMLHLWVFTI